MSSPPQPEIPGYRLIRRFDRGAMSDVFLAERVADGSLVALKLLARGLAPIAKADKRFERERELARRLKHPNLLSILDAGEHEGRQYFVTQYVEGESLHDRIVRQGSEGLFGAKGAARGEAAADCARILAKVARALETAHREQILHRDVKPGNILVRSDGEPFLIDFGIARRLDAETRLTSTDVALGTPFYMSPEQLRGDTEQLSPQSDVWGLGATLHEALTGSIPFRAQSIEGLREQVLYAESPQLPADLGSLSKPLGIVVAKALEKDPRHRFGSAGEMAAELERVLQGAKLHSQAAELAMRRGWRGFVRRRMPVLAGALLAAIAIASLFALRSSRAHATNLELRLQGLYAEAQSCLEFSVPEDALAVLEEAQDLDPTRAETFLHRAIILSQCERPDKVRGALAQARSLGWRTSVEGTRRPFDDLGQALELVAEQRHLEALPLLERVTDVVARGSRAEFRALYPAFLTRYQVERHLGDDIAARRSFEEYRRYSRDVGPLPRILDAISLNLSGDTPGAADFLKMEFESEAFKSSASHRFRCLRKLGYLYDRLGRHEDSERMFREAIRIDPSDAYSLVALGIARFKQGAADDARELAHQGLSRNPRLAVGHLLLAYLTPPHDLDRVWAHLQDAMSCDPSFQPVRLVQAHLLVKEALKRADSPHVATTLLLAAVDRDPRNVRALILLGQFEFNEAATNRMKDEELDVATKDPGWWRARSWFDRARMAQATTAAGVVSEAERPWRELPLKKAEIQMLRVSSFYVACRLGLAEEARERFDELSDILDSINVHNQTNLIESMLRDPCLDCGCVRTCIEDFLWRKRTEPTESVRVLLERAETRCR